MEFFNCLFSYVLKSVSSALLASYRCCDKWLCTRERNLEGNYVKRISKCLFSRSNISTKSSLKLHVKFPFVVDCAPIAPF